MRGGAEGSGCFPTGRHYPGIAHLLRVVAAGLAEEFPTETSLDELRLVVIDTETTGLDAEVDRVVEVACVVYHRGVEVERVSLPARAAYRPPPGTRAARADRGPSTLPAA
jgi:hypothetical protein